jgi:N-hydroxyarylamine O-acetyltransferase
MDVETYLERIGLNSRPARPDSETLRLLQRLHILAVPFENLDIHWLRPITIDIGRFYRKIVVEKRGGFCYELNGLFNEILKALGYTTRLVSARVFDGTDYGPEYDHSAIIVTIGEEQFLADVGFGDFTAEPLRFVLDEVQVDATGEFSIRKFDDDAFEVAKRDNDGWRSQYIFKDIARELSEFAEMCRYQQTSPDSHFTKGKVCSILTETGRKTLTDTNYILTSDGKRHETPVAGSDDFAEILEREFGIRKDG